MIHRKALFTRLGAVSALALALAACGPDDMVGRNVAGADQLALTSALGPYNYSLAEEDWGGGSGDYLPDAYPMQADYPGAYAPAPSWNYDQGGYYDDGYASGWDESDYGYYDAGYVDDYYDDYDDAYYQDDTVGTDQYAWLALAALIGGLLADSPPDYGYYYDGAQPWAWRTHDGYYRYAEPVRGGYRYYYYEPRATRPFLVRDPLYSYGYRDDRLVVVYDRDGRILRHSRARDRRQVASAYFDRGERLYTAAQRGDRFGVSAPLWQQRRRAIVTEQQHWDRARERRKEWREWDNAHEDAAERRWQRERRARRSAAQRFDSWQEAGYREEAPRFYRDGGDNRARLQRAALVRENARDERRERRPEIERDRSERREVRRGGNRADREAGFARAEVEREQRDPHGREVTRRSDRRQENARQQRTEREQVQRISRQREERAQRDRQQRQSAQRERAQRERAQQQREERQQAQRERQRAERDRRDRERTRNERRRSEQAQEERRQQAQQARRNREQAERQQRQQAERQRQQREQARQERQQRERAQQQRRERQQAERQRQQRDQARQERQQRAAARQERQQNQSAQRGHRQQQAEQNDRRQRAPNNRDRSRERGNDRGRGRGND